jgi:hypothetical protein
MKDYGIQRFTDGDQSVCFTSESYPDGGEFTFPQLLMLERIHDIADYDFLTAWGIVKEIGCVLSVSDLEIYLKVHAASQPVDLA